MSKPIFIIKSPHLNDQDRKEFIETMNKELAKDYHVLIYDDEEAKTFRFQMFSDHEIEPIELDKLKEIVKPK